MLTRKMIRWTMGWVLVAVAARGEVRVLCSTFPIYQITRNVAQTRPGAQVDLLLPAGLGCPHDYALKPQDLHKLARADVFVVNGLGMEEFLGAPVHAANPRVVVVDSSQGLTGLLSYACSAGCGDTAAPFEWAGAFQLEPGWYRWTFAQRDGRYADLGMKLLLRASPAAGRAALERERAGAGPLWSGAARARVADDELVPGDMPFALTFDPARTVTVFRVRVEVAGSYVFFTEHHPAEFEAGAHFFQDAAGRAIEPVAEEPAAGSGHDHHHHHGGHNPHLFASPRQSALLALRIGDALAGADPAGAEAYRGAARAYAGRLNQLADDLHATVRHLRSNRIVQPHGVFDYLARDIGLEIVGTTQPHGQEPSAAELLDLVKTIRARQAGAVFTEPQYPPAVGQTIARETGLPVAVLDPVASGPADAPLDYYEQAMRRNLETLRATLGASP